jgi:hypothetical protein
MLANRDARRPRRRRGPSLPREQVDGRRVFVDADGELLIIPQSGALRSSPSLAGSTSRRARSRWSRAA